MKIKSAHLTRFSVFSDLNIDFSPGINVFIGANGTGKSHLLKLLYGVWKVAERDREAPDEEFVLDLKRKLAGLFKPGDQKIGHLLTPRRGGNTANISIKGDDSQIDFLMTNRGRLEIIERRQKSAPKPLFIPSREALSMYKGFTHAYENRELSFDETYYDLCKALSASTLQGPHGKKISGLAEPLEDLLGGKVRLEGDLFKVRLKSGDMVSHLLSEGYRKIACLIHLIRNGSLTDKGVLFWDVPEANLNPKMTMKIRDALLELAQNGTQIFLATHDYLLAHELSHCSEYGKSPVNLRFFGLTNQDGLVTHQSGKTLVDIDDNPILDEFSAHYDREQMLINGC